MNSIFSKGRYLVTGGAGFIGSHLCERLIEMGCEVIAVDNFITGSRGNLRTLLGARAFSFIEQDIGKPLALEGMLAGIFHLASPASPVDYIKYPIETLRAGALGTDQILQLALAKSCPTLVASTSEVYGDPLVHPQVESYWGNVNPIGIRSCYDESKRYQEALTMAYHRTRNVNTHIVRIFNTYGPRMRLNDGRVVPNFCVQALQGQDVTVYGDGKQTRSFCFVSDLVEGLLRALHTSHHEPINLGNPVEMLIIEFAQAIIRLTSSRSKIRYLSLPQDDPKIRCPQIDKAKQILGWKPTIDLESGLRKTIDYFRSQLQQQAHSSSQDSPRVAG